MRVNTTTAGLAVDSGEEQGWLGEGTVRLARFQRGAANLGRRWPEIGRRRRPKLGRWQPELRVAAGAQNLVGAASHRERKERERVVGEI
jgi:hypothetical protein